MNIHSNPRSVLHALKPFGVGTPEVESLLSYMCRLAVSHRTSTLALTRTVAALVQHEISPTYDWYTRHISGLGDSALTWSSALSALTTVPGLDGLTLLPWRDVVALNGFALVTEGQFCPHCLAEDRVADRTPYFRLAWEPAQVTVCHRHKTALHRNCASCGAGNVRHGSPFVVPGWCTRCGEFLGKEADRQADECPPAAGALWRARQIGELLAVQHRLTKPANRGDLLAGVSSIITEMDCGQPAVFARRHDLGKSTVHHWLKGPGTPKLDVSLNIAVRSGLSLVRLLTGDLEGWQPPAPCEQRTLELVHPPRALRAPPRQLDWDDIEQKLEAMFLQLTPISVVEAAKRLEVEPRQLYLRANRVTRQIGSRWVDYLRRQQAQKLEKAWPYLEAACRELKNQGRAVTRREIAKRVPAEILATVPRLLHVLKDVQRRMGQTYKSAQRPGG